MLTMASRRASSPADWEPRRSPTTGRPTGSAAAAAGPLSRTTPKSGSQPPSNSGRSDQPDLSGSTYALNRRILLEAGGDDFRLDGLLELLEVARLRQMTGQLGTIPGDHLEAGAGDLLQDSGELRVRHAVLQHFQCLHAGFDHLPGAG